MSGEHAAAPAAAASAAKKMSAFAIPILIVFMCAGVSIGAGMLYGEKRSIEWMISLFFKLAVPLLLIGWAAKKMRE